jgi:tetratricopeptide (TPR) repeat protein
MSTDATPIKVPYRLRRKPCDRTVAALFFEQASVAAILHTCAELGLDPAGRTFRAGEGLLLKLDGPPRAGTTPHATRLWALAPNLLLPIDAALLPALLDDEASGLTRDRGLLFLPNEIVLAFDPKMPVSSSLLLFGKRRPARSWKELREPRRLAQRIDEILVALPGNAFDPDADEHDVDDAVFDPEDTDVGSEKPRPKDTGPLKNFTGGSMLNAGQWILKLGQSLGWNPLAKAGANLIRRAMEVAPRLSESVLGAQEAALRALLQEFRDGNTERAMRHALPLGDSAMRGSDVHTGTKLPTHNLNYALNNLLGGDGRDSVSYWLGGQSLMSALAREYRQAAEQALRQGDHRRAALIFGKLLRDYRMAAHALLRGGLYRDAAAIFLARLDDTRSAAQALESAGDVDGALKLYRSREEHVAAGDLLRRVGEEEAALVEYILAAERLADTSVGGLAAGDLLVSRTGRTDLALPYFRASWDARPAQNAVPSAHRLARIFAEEGRVEELFSLLAETDEFFLMHGQEQAAGQFYNDLVCLADAPRIESLKDRLRDHALNALATKMRQQVGTDVRAGSVLAALFGQPGVWSQTLLNDADFAMASALRAAGRSAPAQTRTTSGDRVRVGSGTVTATCSATISGELFVGFDNGDVYCFRPASSEVVLVGFGSFPVVSLAAEHNGRSISVLRATAEHEQALVQQDDHQFVVQFELAQAAVCTLTRYERRTDDSYFRVLELSPEVTGIPWLTSVLSRGPADVLGLWTGQQLDVLELSTLTPTGAPLVPEWSDLKLAILVAWPGKPGYTVLCQEGSTWQRYDPSTGAHGLSDVLQGQACSPAPLHPRPAPVEVWDSGSRLELAWIGTYGTLHWTALRVADRALKRISSGTSAERGGYRAAVLPRPGLVAGIAGDRVDWFWGGAERLRHFCTTLGGLDNIVAGFCCRLTGELILINARGDIRGVFVPL